MFTKLTNTKNENLLSSEVWEGVSEDKRKRAEKLIDKINKEDWLPERKRLYAGFLAQELKADGALPNILEKRFSVWGKDKKFGSYVETVLVNNMEKFRIAGMVCCMSATLVFYFAKAMITGNYLVGFSVDALVGVIAIVLLIHNIQLKYGLTRGVSRSRDFLYLDLLALLLCTLFKIILPVNLDLSLIVLIIAYFAEKKKFASAEQEMRQSILH